ncbi:MAG: hypothetical protein JWO38_620 [Gemmataceae bacterium]|nr:hypothetical protein [Gemmataceae bacterium]
MAGNGELNPDAVRAWVGDFEVGKGRPYAEGPAVSGGVRSGDTLRASVKGTRNRPYRVSVRLAGGAVAGAGCSCPVGFDGRCKHVAAVLLAYTEDPARFADLPDIDANLTARGRDELVGLVKQLLRLAPELEPLLAAPLPGFTGTARPTPDYYRRQAWEVIRGVNPHNDWAEVEIAHGLTDVLQTATEFAAVGDAPAERAVYQGVAEAVTETGLGRGRLGVVFAALPEPHRAALVERMGFGEPPAAQPF